MRSGLDAYTCDSSNGYTTRAQRDYRISPSGLEIETLNYLAIPGVSLTQAQIIALNQNIIDIKYGAGVALAAVTGRLATVDLGAFIDSPSVDIRAYRGFKATFVEGAHTAVALIGEPGMGETLDAETLTNGDFASDLGSWDLTLALGAIAWDAGTCKFTQGGVSSNLYASQDITSVSGALYKAVAVVTATTEANYKQLRLGTSQVGLQIASSGYGGAGTKTIYGTATTATTWMSFQDGGAILSTSNWDNGSLKRVLTPSALGSLLYKLDGTTRSFESNDGLLPNTAWTVTVTRP